jgi:hypothetical protein
MTLPYFKNPHFPPFTCHICGKTNAERFIHPPTPHRLGEDFVSDQAICGPCFLLGSEAAKQRFLEAKAALPEWVDDQLALIGLAGEERKAELDKVPQLILGAIPDALLHRLMAGNLPKDNGLGLAGMAGTGKSQTMAALVKASILQNAANRIQFFPLRPVKQVFWMNVPVTFDRWRTNFLDWKVETNTKKAMESKLLILDDLGRETRRREATEDVATGRLDAILTQREREGLPTLWTTNMSYDELIDRYGTSMIRRLCRLNPMTWLDDAGFYPEAM